MMKRMKEMSFLRFPLFCAPEKIIRQEIKNCENIFRRSFFLMNACIFSIATFFYYMLIKQGIFLFSNLLDFTKKGCSDFKSSSEWKLDEGNGFFCSCSSYFYFWMNLRMIKDKYLTSQEIKLITFRY